jgi:hypothetical protein
MHKIPTAMFFKKKVNAKFLGQKTDQGGTIIFHSNAKRPDKRRSSEWNLSQKNTPVTYTKSGWEEGGGGQITAVFWNGIPHSQIDCY